MNRIAGRARATVLLVLILLSGFTFFLVEFFVRADEWVIFPRSPHVYTNGNFDRGVVTDREEYLLLDLRNDRVYANDAQLRKATVHWVGDRYGEVDDSAVTQYASQLVGFDYLNGLYSYDGSVGVAELTLSARAQRAALDALGDYNGTVAVYNYKTGELICSVSTPTFDPDSITSVTEGMYLNNFVQGYSYIPGSIFKIVTLAAALDCIADIEQQTFTCTGSVPFGPDEVTCEGAHWDQDLKTAFRNSCNCAFAQIALQVGGERLEQYAKQFGLTEPITFDGIESGVCSIDAADAAPVNVAWSGIGQHHDRINPCSFLTFVGAIANGGKGVNPYVVGSVRVGKETTYQADTQLRNRIMPEDVASRIREYMFFNVQDKYGEENFPGLTVGAKTGTGEVGGGKKPNAMLTGFVEDEQYPLAFIVVVEDGGYGAQVCIPIISQVLEACKASLK